MIGPQTVPRAEIKAFSSLLTYLLTTSDYGHLDVHTDNKAVYDGVRAGKPQQMRNRENDDMWDIFWDLWEGCINAGWTFNVHKVKSHTDQAHIEAGILTIAQQEGNGVADHWAKEGAKINQIPDERSRIIDWIDATTWIVQKRLLAIAMNCQSKKSPKKEAILEVNAALLKSPQ